jgi:hypothetical protein
MDMDGTNGPGKQAKKATDCCADCLAEPGCNGVTFYDGFCYMKHHATSAFRNDLPQYFCFQNLSDRSLRTTEFSPATDRYSAFVGNHTEAST